MSESKHTRGCMRAAGIIGAMFSKGTTKAHRAYVAEVIDRETRAPNLIAALEDVALRATQAKIASNIGKKKDRSDFLRSELDRICAAARAAIAKAEGRA